MARGRADPRADADRVALWFFSGGGLLTADRPALPPAWLRRPAAACPILAPLPDRGLSGTRFRPDLPVADAGGNWSASRTATTVSSPSTLPRRSARPRAAPCARWWRHLTG